MTWLIVGGHGQLGNALSTELNNRELQFFSLGSKELDIRSPNDTFDYISNLKPSVIINAAAWTNVDSAESNLDAAMAVNVQGTHNLVLAASAVNAVFVQISTDYVFSGTRSKPWNVDDLREPISVYGKTKAAGEDAVLSGYPENSYVFRSAWLYSQWGKNFAKTMTKLALDNNGNPKKSNKINVVDDQVGQPTSASDLSNRIIDVVRSQISFGVYHLTNSGEATWYEFAQEVFKLSNGDIARLVPTTSSQFEGRAKRPAYSVLGHDGWDTTSLAPMRNWRDALAEAMPSIISAVEEEE